ncbi:MAG: hypothetical protein K2K93_00955 [Muribaculaceae bacterium]|nr:hypothetical protein [Muribaculaceae bacterium]
MKTENSILEKAGHETGYKVPENYFDNVRKKIISELPEYPVEKQEKISTWTRIKPYLYMAAMFAGIWCMMKMFHTITSSDLNFDNPPEAVVMAMASADHHDWIPAGTDNSEMYLMEDDVCSEYSDIEDFKRDFNQTGI